KVKVENLTGHKFPTGYAETRRAWVGVTLVTADMKETALAGGYDLATGQIQAKPAIHVYRAEHGTWDGTKGVAESHLALHDMIISDTRIPPAGFKASPTTTPTSEIDFADGNGGYKSSDEVTLDLVWPADASGEVTVSARLYYQSMTKDYVDFLKAANKTNAKGDELATVFQATGEGAPLVIAKSDATLGQAMTTATGAGGGGVGGGATASTSTSSAGGGGSGGATPRGGTDSGCGCSDAGAPASAAGGVMGMLFLAFASSRRRLARAAVARS
ncbi:MAG: hypothetical protein ABJE95_33650, partial [Byssovorax sp.]